VAKIVQMAGNESIFFWLEFGTVHRAAFVFTTLFQLASNAQADDAKIESVLRRSTPTRGSSRFAISKR